MYLRGTYTKFTLFDKITIVGVDPLLSIITGVHTPPTSGTVTFDSIVLTSATHIFSSASAGTTNITLITCVWNVTSGYVFNLLNWTGTLFFYGSGPQELPMVVLITLGVHCYHE